MGMSLPVQPMLAEKVTLRGEPGREWQTGRWMFEQKLDGHRAIAVIDNGVAVLWSRTGNAMRVAEVEEELKAVAFDGMTFDGELVWREEGRESRQRLANAGSASAEDRRRCLKYVVFDVLRLHESTLRQPWLHRRGLLDALDLPAYTASSSGTLQAVVASPDVVTYWQYVEVLGLEGLIAKPAGSLYVPGERGTWKKLKRLVREKFVIVGWTAGTGGREGTIGALVLAEQQDDGEYRYAGKVGTGFTGRTLADLMSEFEPLTAERGPFEKGQAVRARQHIGAKRVTWLKPSLVAEVEFSERSEDGTPIFPSFKGLVW